MKIILTLSIILFLLPNLCAQTYNCIVRNKEQKPIHLANVTIKNTPYGTATNYSGEFLLNGLSDNDTLIISHIGYETYEIEASALPATITLEPHKEILSELTIYNLNPQEIIHNAIKSNNYNINYRIEGFFREALYKNDTLNYLSEACIQLKVPSHNNSDGKVFITEKQTLYSNNCNDVINGPLSIINMNDVLVHKVFLKPNKIRHYKFEITNYLFYENTFVYEIKFQPLKKNSKNVFFGTIYIDQDNYNIYSLDIGNNRTRVISNFKLINDKMVISNFSIEKNELKNNNILRGKVNYTTTNFTKCKINGQRFYKDNVLNKYTNTYDSNYWLNKHIILKDSTLRKQINKLQQTQAPSTSITTHPPLYHPSISYTISNKLFNDIDLLSSNLNSINRLMCHTLNNEIENKSLASFAQTAYCVFFALPFQGAEAERRIFAQNNYNVTYNPIIFNSYFSSYCKGISNNELENLKSANITDFLRLHTIRYESNFSSIKEIEEELFEHDFLNNTHKDDFLNTWFIDYFIRRIYMTTSILTSSIDFNYPQKSEQKMPYSTNRINSYIKYLYDNNESFKRDITSENLTTKEAKHASQLRWFSCINLIPSITNLLPPINLNNNYTLRISGAYLPIVFGNQFEQNLYINNKQNLAIINFRQFFTYSKFGIGIGFKYIDLPLGNHLSTSFQTDYWKQPKSFSFYDKELTVGFSVKQNITYHSNKTNYWFGWSFKTDGYIDYASTLNQDFSIQLGTMIAF